jgi:tRNA threonylcarbamoyl adenosine modification protein YeaZ
LAIETTGRQGSVAVLAGERVLQKVNLASSPRTAATLAPQIQATLQWCRQRDAVPNLISIAAGPGSFTGLRIGVTTAKTLAYALALPLVAVDSVAAIAAAAFADWPRAGDSLWAAIDAYRGQVFAGQFTRAELVPPIVEMDPSWTALPGSVAVYEEPRWRDLLHGRPPATRLTGDAKPLDDLFDSALPRDCDAVGVGLLGYRAAVLGQFVDPLQLVPRYLKLSAAEEKLAPQT